MEHIGEDLWPRSRDDQDQYVPRTEMMWLSQGNRKRTMKSLMSRYSHFDILLGEGACTSHFSRLLSSERSS